MKENLTMFFEVCGGGKKRRRRRIRRSRRIRRRKKKKKREGRRINYVFRSVRHPNVQ